MKKAFLAIVPVLGLVAMTMSSCSSNCCTLLTAKICEDDFDGTLYDNWDDAKEYYESAGWSCD
jgi:hypothetical protein